MIFGASRRREGGEHPGDVDPGDAFTEGQAEVMEPDPTRCLGHRKRSPYAAFGCLPLPHLRP